MDFFSFAAECAGKSPVSLAMTNVKANQPITKGDIQKAIDSIKLTKEDLKTAQAEFEQHLKLSGNFSGVNSEIKDDLNAVKWVLKNPKLFAADGDPNTFSYKDSVAAGLEK